MSHDSDDNTLAALRAALFETLRGVRAGTVDLDRARAVNDIGKTLIDSAKVEVDYLRAVDGCSSDFLGGAAQEKPPALPAGILSVRQHRLRG